MERRSELTTPSRRGRTRPPPACTWVDPPEGPTGTGGMVTATAMTGIMTGDGGHQALATAAGQEASRQRQDTELIATDNKI